MTDRNRPCTAGRDPAPGATALVIVDMINPLDFDEAGGMLEAAEAAADAVVRLRDQADEAGVPVVYVNDNQDEWHSDRERLVERCLKPGGTGHRIVERLRPRDGDFFVIKPQFSGFYATNLPVLLPRLKVGRLVLTGIAADICVLFTAADAHMREYDLWVPSDAVAANSTERTRWALEIMGSSMHAETRSTTEMSLDRWIARAA